MISSKSGKVWLNTLSTARDIKFARLYVAIITLTVGEIDRDSVFMEGTKLPINLHKVNLGSRLSKLND
jgi:hypothetical protein